MGINLGHGTARVPFRARYEQFLAWQASQQQQTDGYAYEESFADRAQQMNQQMFTIALRQQGTPTRPESAKKSDDRLRLARSKG